MAHSDSYSVLSGYFPLEIKGPGREVDHSLRLQMSVSYTSVPPICLEGVDRDFTFFIPSCTTKIWSLALMEEEAGHI